MYMEDSYAFYSQDSYLPPNRIHTAIGMLRISPSQPENVFWNLEPDFSKISVNTDNLNDSSVNQNIDATHSGSQNSDNSDFKMCNSLDNESVRNLTSSHYLFMSSNLNAGDILSQMSNSPRLPPAVWDLNTTYNQTETHMLDTFPAVCSFSNQNLFATQSNLLASNHDVNGLMPPNVTGFPNIGITNSLGNTNYLSDLNNQHVSPQLMQNTYTNLNTLMVPISTNNGASIQNFAEQTCDGLYNIAVNSNSQLPQNCLIYSSDNSSNIPAQISRSNLIVQIYQNGQPFLATIDQNTYNALIMNAGRTNIQFQATEAIPQVTSNSTIRTNRGKSSVQSSIIQKNFEQLDLMENPANWRRMPNSGGYMCNICTKCYTRKYGLKIHLRIHSGFKPLECKICRKKFGDPSNMAKHIRLHSTETSPYKCTLCEKQLVRRRDLERHMRSRHPDISTKQSLDNNKRKR